MHLAVVLFAVSLFKSNDDGGGNVNGNGDGKLSRGSKFEHSL